MKDLVWLVLIVVFGLGFAACERTGFWSAVAIVSGYLAVSVVIGSVIAASIVLDDILDEWHLKRHERRLRNGEPRKYRL